MGPSSTGLRFLMNAAAFEKEIKQRGEETVKAQQRLTPVAKVLSTDFQIEKALDKPGAVMNKNHISTLYTLPKQFACRSCRRELPPGKPGRQCANCRLGLWEKAKELNWNDDPRPPFGKLIDSDGVPIKESIIRINLETGEAVYVEIKDGDAVRNEDGTPTEYATKYRAPVKFIPNP